MSFHKCSSAGCKVFFNLLIFAANIFILASVINNLALLIDLGAVVLENVRKQEPMSMQELATPILSLCHGIFTDRSIFSTPFLL